MIIPHSRPLIEEDDIKAVAEVLASGHIAQGEKVKEFENAVANFVGVKHAVACSSGTAAIHLALNSLNIKEGDEVIMPSYVCSSPYFATSYTGAKPIIADIDLSDLNISIKSVHKRTSTKTKAIIMPHMFGTPAEIEEFLDLGVHIIEDCAQSLGAKYKNKLVGSFGDLAVISFYATKMITTGEGGMILTNNSELYYKILDVRDYDKKPLAPIKYNYKMTDFQAALGISQLKKLHHFIKRRLKIATLYNEKISGYGVKLLRVPDYKESVFYRYVIMVKEAEKVRMEALKNGIVFERPVYSPLHKSFPSLKCPSSDEAYKKALSIPIYPSLREDEISQITSAFDKIFASECV
ncbi:MAG: DegT/DnrJ/EryC1/StrS aminotransferase family protein [Candidatus Bathyarchaeia archaeon]